jgi:hypothetical protein
MVKPRPSSSLRPCRSKAFFAAIGQPPQAWVEKQFAGTLSELIIPPEVPAWLKEESVASDLVERVASE